VAAFREYQLNKAWVWEHQAITRARFVAGDVQIGEAFDAIRLEVLKQPRDIVKLKNEVTSMREKMRAANKNTSELFDLKHDAGGVIDVEFLVQYWVLANAQNYTQLTENIGNIALLKTLATLNIIDKKLSQEVAIAYREYRKMQRALKLQGITQTSVEVKRVEVYVSAVIKLWAKVFG
jgi:glutamate-ammonia-ligase adenylyltransferase